MTVLMVLLTPLSAYSAEIDLFDEIEQEDGYYLFTEEHILAIIEIIIDLRDEVERLERENETLWERIELEREKADEVIKLQGLQIEQQEEVIQLFKERISGELWIKILLLIAGVGIGQIL